MHVSLLGHGQVGKPRRRGCADAHKTPLAGPALAARYERQWDFLYFSTSIGATSQTADTAIRSHSLRRLVTLHAVIAFFFNTAVLALAVNIAASLA